jgi:hypothetical protein
MTLVAVRERVTRRAGGLNTPEEPYRSLQRGVAEGFVAIAQTAVLAGRVTHE